MNPNMDEYNPGEQYWDENHYYDLCNFKVHVHPDAFIKHWNIGNVTKESDSRNDNNVEKSPTRGEVVAVLTTANHLSRARHRTRRTDIFPNAKTVM